MIASPARPARIARIAPDGWMARDGRRLAPADQAACDASAARRMAGLPAGWPLPHGMIAVVTPVAGLIHVIPRPAI